MTDKPSRLTKFLERESEIIDRRIRENPGKTGTEFTDDAEIDRLLANGDRAEIAACIARVEHLIQRHEGYISYFRAILAGEHRPEIPLTPERIAWAERSLHVMTRAAAQDKLLLGRLKEHL